MKILYVGTERAEARAIVAAVNGLGERVTVSWTSGLDRVASWLDENDGVRVLLVEAQPNGRVWRSVLTYAAGLPTALPVVVIFPEEIASDEQQLTRDGHECVARNPSLLRDLPAVITRAIEQARQRQLERAVPADLKLKLEQATATIQEAAQRHQFAIAAAAEQLAKSQSQYEIGMARAAATRDMVNEQFREASNEVERVRLRHAAAVADVERLARREAELSEQVESATKTKALLERRLADAETALHADETRQREFERKISEETDKRRGVEGALARALSASTAAEQRHASATSAAAVKSRELHAALSAARHALESKAAHLDALATREADLASMLTAATTQAAERQTHFDREHAEAEAKRTELTAQLREVEEARDQARREQQSAVADITRLTEREAELDRQLKGERETRDALEQEVARAPAALRDEQERHWAEVATAAVELAERQTQFERERTEAEAKLGELTAQLREVEEARDHARLEQQSAVADIKRLTEREAELEVHLKQERETRDTLEQEVARAAGAIHDEQEQHRAALATAAAELAERQTQFERERAEAEAKRGELTAQLREVEEARDLAQREHQSAVADVKRLTEREAALEGRLNKERETRDALAQEIAGAAAALRDEKERHHAALATSAAQLTDHQAHFDRERAESETERAGLIAQLREVEEARDHARHEHEAVVRELTRVTEYAAAERESAARCQRDLEARIDTLRADSLLQAAQFDEQRREHENRLELAHTAASAAIQQLTAERQEIERRFDEATREHAAVLATRENDFEQLRLSLTAGIKQLEVELQKSRADNHRLFQQAPLPMFRCTKDGVLAQANRMLTTLAGRRSPDELHVADWAATVFESPNDLSWLIERCLGSRGKESIETAWRRKDGSRLFVRLSACATSSDLIEASVEDLTPIRVLNDRLSQAHRMEAVGRLATEVAVTCGSLLSDVHQNVQQLLMTEGGNLAARHRGEMLLEEISRAAGLLRQLATYGDEESRKPAIVDLRTVVRDIAPVLKRVAGDGVDVQLPAGSAPLNVDAGAERVQRLLVNLAAYGRERMPLGGQLKIELGTIVVDRHFTAKHPNVRLGPHAIVTVTESRRAIRTEGLLPLHDNETESGSQSVAVQTRVDLGALQELVGECGGHLWMTVQPLGGMIVKIRLPLVTSYGEPPRRASASGSRVRTLGNWFQH